MNLTVTGKQIDISKPFRAHVEEKLSTLNSKYAIDPVDVMVIISHENFNFYCEISAHIGRGMHIRCHKDGSDAYSCYDNAIDVLEHRLRRHKKRLHDHNRKRDVHLKEEIAPIYVLDMQHEESDNNTSEDLAPPIIAEIKSQIPTLTVGEAVMRMDLGNENPYIFRNSKHGRLNVVYRREDGNIGWVDVPQEEPK